MEAATPIEETMAELSKPDQPLRNLTLAQLSDLGSEEFKHFVDLWAFIEAKQRRQILHRLIELAEENLELDFDPIFKYCLKDEDAEVRTRAIEGLWENEEASLINPLINLLERDSSGEVQASAAMALGKFAVLAEHKKLSPSQADRIEETLLTVVDNENKPVEVRRRALEAAAPLSLPKVKQAIRQAYHSPNPRLKISSIYAMGKNCDPSWLPILLKELASSDSEMRYEAAGACGELEEEEAVPHLIELVNDPDVDVQMTAIQALGKIGGNEAKRCLENCLGSSSEAIRQTAEQTLSGLQGIENLTTFRFRSA